MADVLTHVLVGFIIGVGLSFRIDWLGPEHVTLVMVGALSPDLMKLALFLPDTTVSRLLGVPFSWSPLHTLGGSVLVILLGSLLLAPPYRKWSIVLLALGAVSHHVLDLALLTPTGSSYAVFWPLWDSRPPAGGLYVSSDRWPALGAGLVAAVVWLGRRRQDSARHPVEE
ncbi:metal-dependent hydrolase [Natrialbaceae archaeon GCM10025810]|uniref:metal-dependent hydrolase n=1 Tax=Halovalidus salilacus TaxID=3075124 RepID=UPI003620573C